MDYALIISAFLGEIEEQQEKIVKAEQEQAKIKKLLSLFVLNSPEAMEALADKVVLANPTGGRIVLIKTLRSLVRQEDANGNPIITLGLKDSKDVIENALERAGICICEWELYGRHTVWCNVNNK